MNSSMRCRGDIGIGVYTTYDNFFLSQNALANGHHQKNTCFRSFTNQFLQKFLSSEKLFFTKHPSKTQQFQDIPENSPPVLIRGGFFASASEARRRNDTPGTSHHVEQPCTLLEINIAPKTTSFGKYI